MGSWQQLPAQFCDWIWAGVSPTIALGKRKRFPENIICWIICDFLMMDTSINSSCMWWHHQTGLLQGCNQPEPNRIAMSLMQNIIEYNCPACAWARSHPFQPGEDWWAPGERKLQPRAMHGSQLWNLAGGKKTTDYDYAIETFPQSSTCHYPKKCIAKDNPVAWL